MKFDIPIWIYIVGGVWAALCAVLIVFMIMKKKAKNKCSVIVEQIKQSIHKINKVKIVAKYNKLESYKVTNQQNEFINNEIKPKLIKYKTNYTELNKQYQKLLAKFENNKVFNLENDLEDVRVKFKSLQFNAEKIAKNINTVFDQEKDNREIVEILKVKLSAFEQTYLTSEDVFYYPKLSTEFYDLIAKYNTIENDNNVDYDYLVETSKNIYDKIKALEDCVLTYPNIYKDANESYKRLGELNELYENLIEQKYNLDEIDFEEKYETFTQALNELLTLLVNLEEVDTSVISQVTSFVDDCYLRFEDEISAKENLNQKYGLYEKNSLHLEKIANEFEIEMKEIAKYEIGTETKVKIGELQKEIDLYLDRYKNLVDFLSNHKIDYSRANNEAREINVQIEKLIEKAKELIVVSKQTRKDEIQAKNEFTNLQDMLNESLVSSMQAQISFESVNNAYTQSCVVLKKLHQALNDDKINIERVNQFLSNAINVVSDFKISIEKQVLLKKVAKNTLIYANRYRSSNENDLALGMCERLVTQGYYKRAIENIYNVISRCENVASINDFIYTWEQRS